MQSNVDNNILTYITMHTLVIEHTALRCYFRRRASGGLVTHRAYSRQGCLYLFHDTPLRSPVATARFDAYLAVDVCGQIIVATSTHTDVDIFIVLSIVCPMYSKVVRARGFGGRYLQHISTRQNDRNLTNFF